MTNAAIKKERCNINLLYGLSVLIYERVVLNCMHFLVMKKLGDRSFAETLPFPWNSRPATCEHLKCH